MTASSVERLSLPTGEELEQVRAEISAWVDRLTLTRARVEEFGDLMDEVSVDDLADRVAAVPTLADVGRLLVFANDVESYLTEAREYAQALSKSALWVDEVRLAITGLDHRYVDIEEVQ